MTSNGFGSTQYTSSFDLEGVEHNTGQNALVPIGGKLPCQSQVSTPKLLDVLTGLSPAFQRLNPQKKKESRKKLNEKLYNRTRPGFYMEVLETLHLAYAGQPNGHGTLHYWRLFFDERLKDQLEVLIQGTALTASEHQAHSSGHQANRNEGSGNYSIEWGGLYLRSEAEMKIASALDQTGVLFFANARGRVGLQDTLVSNNQLTGRVEADFLILHRGKCMVLEVDGQHHLELGQVIRDYARDRVLLRDGVPTVRFTARDCLDRPNEVVSEFLSILQAQ
jgi:very-short-patch-repair endonuclease